MLVSQGTGLAVMGHSGSGTRVCVGWSFRAFIAPCVEIAAGAFFGSGRRGSVFTRRKSRGAQPPRASAAAVSEIRADSVGHDIALHAAEEAVIAVAALEVAEV